MILWSLLLGAALSHAYIPEYSLIASRAAEQHGRGGYWIEQEVRFKKDNETLSVKESWLVLNENLMRVTLEGQGPLKNFVHGTILYEGGQKIFVDGGSAKMRNQRLGEEWLEPLFHFRSSKYFRSRLVNMRIAPQDSLHDRAPLNSEGDPLYEVPGFVHFSRVGGDTAWAIEADHGINNHPAAWIEQDQFVLRKLRTGSLSLMKADDYAKYDDGLWFPRVRTHNFGNYSVEVQTLSVKSLGKLKVDDARFRASQLKPARDAVKLPEVEPLKEFYSRFR